MTDKPSKDGKHKDDLERMNKALKAALETPPTKHKDEPKRQRPTKEKRK